MKPKAALKHLLGEIPFTAELYWQLRQPGKPLSKSFSLKRVEQRLPLWLPAVAESRQRHPEGQKLVIFATLRYWIEHAALVGLALAGLGHDVTLAYLPYANWRKPFNRFDLRRQNAYARTALQKAEPWLHSISFLDVNPAPELPEALKEAIREISRMDVQYTLQVEAVDTSSELYQLREDRNRQAAAAALAWLQANRPDALLTPNGSILEMGAVYQAARYLDIPVVTYEFGEQRGRIWLARDEEIMRQDTRALWAARQDEPLTPEQAEQIHALFAARQRADLWANFSRRWQGQPSQGGEQARKALDLDDRPVVLLAANVIGDSLTLGRQVFTDSMTEWLERTVLDFAQRPEVQLVVRIHPGERYAQGPSVADVVRRVLPELPEHIHLVPADDPLNTYDIVEIATVGMVYTTTTGMEMAMSGVPVIVVGQTHYRGKGFTLDPASWDEYTRLLDQVLAQTEKAPMSRAQVERAWAYAYRFFFDYPCPFPWHLLYFYDELKTWPLERVLSAEGQAEFGQTFAYLAGAQRDWQTEARPAAVQS